jgi:hypothetical protein
MYAEAENAISGQPRSNIKHPVVVLEMKENESTQIESNRNPGSRFSSQSLLCVLQLSDYKSVQYRVSHSLEARGFRNLVVRSAKVLEQTPESTNRESAPAATFDHETISPRIEYTSLLKS